MGEAERGRTKTKGRAGPRKQDQANRVRLSPRRRSQKGAEQGPEGGDGGGTIVATGTPEEIAKVKESYTGDFLKRIL